MTDNPKSGEPPLPESNSSDQIAPPEDRSEPVGELDPLYVSSLREAKGIATIWGVSFLWVLGYCTLFGYQTDATDLRLVWGMPSWVFWGILLPWIASVLATTWFALTQMKDHPLPEESQAERTNG